MQCNRILWHIFRDAETNDIDLSCDFGQQGDDLLWGHPRGLYVILIGATEREDAVRLVCVLTGRRRHRAPELLSRFLVAFRRAVQRQLPRQPSGLGASQSSYLFPITDGEEFFSIGHENIPC